MKQLILITLLTMLTSCGALKELLYDVLPDPQKPKARYTNKTFLDIINDFQSNFNNQVNIPVQFDNEDGNETLGSGTAGVCYYRGNTGIRIVISASYWSNLENNQKEQLLFHELGHCVLHIWEHIDAYNNNCPSSIMNSYAFNLWDIDNCYIPNHQYYVNDLNSRKR